MKYKLVTTDYTNNRYWDIGYLESNKKSEEQNLLAVYPKIEFQKIKGFGGAFTEASAYNYNFLNKKDQERFISDYFSEKGLNYNLGRIHMNSCDFSLGNYTYIYEFDETLDSFSVERDKELIIPMINDANKEKEIKLLVSPWSPPAFTKDNNEMNHGGKLLKKYYSLWAKYFVKFIKEYTALGLSIDSLTIQNEPEATQTWDSCRYSAAEELSFARVLKEELTQEKIDVKIYGWDHNKEELLNRANGLIKGSTFDGLAVHWYSGDHFENIELCKKMYPEIDVMFTEGCVEYSKFVKDDEIEHAKMYAHDMIGNFKAGISAFYDWNLLLDQKGGPNHVGNFCEALIMLDKNSYKKHLSYYYFGHLSKYVKEGSRVIGSSVFTDKLDTVAFKNPDNQIVVVVLNKSDKNVLLNISIEQDVSTIDIPANSIITLLTQ
jgi:glucosylceramidase